MHSPPVHVSPTEQTVPQPPQSAGLVDVSTQTPPQAVGVPVPAGHVHALFTHVEPPVQASPQPPQLALSFVSSTQDEPHVVRPAPHVDWHVPPEHSWFAPHALPQAPQLFGSVFSLRQTTLAPVPHAVRPLGQAHALFVHTSPPTHATPQPPQLLGSVASATQALLQSVSPAPHVLVQTLLEQTCPPPRHATPQPPQLSGSLVVSTHTPLQSTPWAQPPSGRPPSMGGGAGESGRFALSPRVPSGPIVLSGTVTSRIPPSGPIPVPPSGLAPSMSPSAV
jgi:hypothetical protein